MGVSGEWKGGEFVPPFGEIWKGGAGHVGEMGWVRLSTGLLHYVRNDGGRNDGVRNDGGRSDEP